MKRQIKEYTLLGDLGFEEFIPEEHRQIFIKREKDGTFFLPLQFNSYVNSHGFGMQFVEEMNDKGNKGTALFKALKEPLNKTKYQQNQINDLSKHVRSQDVQIEKL